MLTNRFAPAFLAVLHLELECTLIRKSEKLRIMSWLIGGVFFLPNDIHHTRCPYICTLIHWSENTQIMSTVLLSLGTFLSTAIPRQSLLYLARKGGSPL